MNDTLVIVIVIFLAAILMFIFPLMSLSERSDDISQLAVQTATSEFVNNARTKGKVTLADYSSFVQTLAATGNSYDIEMEIKHLVKIKHLVMIMISLEILLLHQQVQHIDHLLKIW